MYGILANVIICLGTLLNIYYSKKIINKMEKKKEDMKVEIKFLNRDISIRRKIIRHMENDDIQKDPSFEELDMVAKNLFYEFTDCLKGWKRDNGRLVRVH
jgi:hypothetical protein